MPEKITVSLAVEVNKKGKVYVSRCPSLDVYSQGDTEEEAIEHIQEALRLFLVSCFERRVLEEVLLESGIKPKKDKLPSEPESQGKVIDIPIPLFAT